MGPGREKEKLPWEFVFLTSGSGTYFLFKTLSKWVSEFQPKTRLCQSLRSSSYMSTRRLPAVKFSLAGLCSPCLRLPTAAVVPSLAEVFPPHVLCFCSCIQPARNSGRSRLCCADWAAAGLASRLQLGSLCCSMPSFPFLLDFPSHFLPASHFQALPSHSYQPLHSHPLLLACDLIGFFPKCQQPHPSPLPLSPHALAHHPLFLLLSKVTPSPLPASPMIMHH